MRMRGLLASVGLAMLSTLIATAAAVAAPVGTITEFSNGVSPNAEPMGITAGPDGNVWFAENGFASTPGGIARITPAGAVTEFRSGLPEFSGPEGITAGPDGNVWFTDSAGAIGRITASGTITEFSAGITKFSDPDTITAGPDGNLWFTELEGRIGRITPAGVITEFPLPPEWQKEDPYGIATGPEGNLWFAERGQYSTVTKEYFGGGIGRITPTGSITEFSNGLPSGSRPDGMAQGPDGNMWFSSGTSKVGRITPAGVITTFSAGITPKSELEGIAAGPDGNMWFPEYAGQRIGRISTSGAVTEFSAGLNRFGNPDSIAAGPDGNVWFAQLEGSESPAGVGSIVSGAAPPLLSAPTVSGGAVAGVPQQCVAAQWSTWAGLQPATSLFAIDGYRFMLDGAQVAIGQSYTPPASSVGHSLTCSETVTYAIQNVTASATSAAVTVVALPAPPRAGSSPPEPPPVLSAVRQSASKWRSGSKPASIARGRKPPLGTTFSFSLNERANVMFSFAQRVSGRRVKGRCVATTTGTNRHRRTCVRTVPRGTLVLAAHAGADRVRFQGRLGGSRKLPPGSYTVTIVAVNAAGEHSQASSLRFTIVR